MALNNDDLNLEERRTEMRRLLLGVTVSSDDHQSIDGFEDDELGILHVTDRWSQVLLETLPPTPWTAVWTANPDVEVVVDVTSLDLESLCAQGRVISAPKDGGSIKHISEGSISTMPLEDLTISELLNEDQIAEDVAKKCNRVLGHLKFFRQHLYMNWDDPEHEGLEGLGGDDSHALFQAVVEEWGDHSVQARYLERLLLIPLNRQQDPDQTVSGGRDQITYDWMEVHFENRFRVFSDFARGESLVYLRMKQMSAEYEGLKDELNHHHRCAVAFAAASDARGDIAESAEASSAIAAARCVTILNRMQALKDEAETTENPDLLKSSIESKREKEYLAREPGFRANVILVWKGGSAQSLTQAMQDLEREVSEVGGVTGLTASETNLMFAPDLTEALERALLPGDVIALPAGVHSASAGLHLPNGVALVGLDAEETVLAIRTYAEDGSDVAGGYHVIADSGVTLKNLLINNETGCLDARGIWAKRSLTMRRCQDCNGQGKMNPSLMSSDQF